MDHASLSLLCILLRGETAWGQHDEALYSQSQRCRVNPVVPAEVQGGLENNLFHEHLHKDSMKGLSAREFTY